MIKTLIIVFGGLVAHVQLPDSTLSTAVLPIDDYHRASIRIEGRDLADRDKDRAADDETCDKKIDQWFCHQKYYVSDADAYIIPLNGIHIEISGLEPKETDASAVRDSIPSLTKISSCRKLKKSVITRNPKDDMAFVDYSGGALLPNMFYDKMGFIADAPGWEVPRCVVCELQLIAPILDDAATLTFVIKTKDRHPLALKPGAKIHVSNTFDNPGPMISKSKMPPHFERFYSLFSDQCEMHTVSSMPGLTCRKNGHLICEVAAFPDPDCTNSHYP